MRELRIRYIWISCFIYRNHSRCNTVQMMTQKLPVTDLTVKKRLFEFFHNSRLIRRIQLEEIKKKI